LIIEYLQWIHPEVADRGLCVLILDIYPAHRRDPVVAVSKECDTEFPFVPAGGTNEYQPPDYRIFGELKL
jgi:hypothetical protein